MTIDLSFNGICKFIKKDYPELIDDIDILFSLVLISSAVITGNPLTATAIASAVGTLSNQFTAKSELPKIGKKILEKITEKKDNDPLIRQQRMEAAYRLICYTAFFEALSHEPQLSDLIKTVKPTPEEKLMLSKSALEQLQKQASISTGKLPESSPPELLELQIGLPHPADTFDIQNKQLLPLYESLAKGFLSFFKGLAVWDSVNAGQRTGIEHSILQLPKKSLEYFKALYFLLATKYEEFYIWSNLQEHEKTRNYLQQMSAFTRKYADLTEASQKSVDLGFHELTELIRLVPEQSEIRNANTTIKELETFYSHSVEEPVIKDTFYDEGKPNLTYPKKSAIFVPQAFKIICYTGKEQLENETTWDRLPRRNDLGTFLLSYFSSPYSTSTPLIILGHPGSGKSLLTSILAARLISPSFTPIRVELRNINAENEIAVQIEDQIYKNTSRKINWATLSDHFSDQPALILFDGYDELLQASGKVFSGYLLKVQKFQENECALGRKPVRAVITSRITLIGKAEIPKGATIIRLLEFDQEQQNTWISVWNSANLQYFQQAHIEPLELPQNNVKTKALAEQPLLLLMLALYDSDDNQLRRQTNLDQTLLYNSLLQRFIERERMKEESFRTLPQKNRTTEIERDMERLGVAAIGMFNRRSLHILAPQLDADLSFFRFERKVQDTGGQKLSQADLLLGSFFFVQESQSLLRNEVSREREIDASFEFLHNTFGEFLTADFILRKVLTQTRNIYKLRSDEEMQGMLAEKLANDEGFKDWFACLMYTPLSSRPVILDMMREWLKHRLKQRKEQEFLQDLDIIVSHQIKRLLNGNTLPSLMTEKGKAPFPNLSIIGHVAIYSLNLIILRTVLSLEGYIFDEAQILPYEDGTRVWERLTHLWRSWFSLQSLNGLSAILTAEREDTKIHLKTKEIFGISLSNNPLDLILEVSLTLADNITAGLSGLVLHDTYGKNAIELHEISKMLNSEKIDLKLILMIKNIRNFLEIFYENGIFEREQFINLANKILRSLEYMQQENQEILLSLFIEIVRLIREMDDPEFIEVLFQQCFRDFERSGRILLTELIIEFLQMVREVDDPAFLEYFYHEYLRKYLQRPERQLPVKLAVEIIRLARELGDWDTLEYFYREYLRKYLQWPNRQLPIELIIESIKLARELGDRDIQYFYRDYVSRDFLQTERQLPVKLAVEIIRLARELGDQTTLEYFYHECLNDFLRPEKQLPVKLAVEIIRLARELKDPSFLEYFRHQYVSRNFLRSERQLPMKLIIEIIQLARELRDQATLEYFYHEYFRNLRSPERQLPVKLIVEIIWLARELRDPGFLEYFRHQYLRDFQRFGRRLPVELAIEIIRLAREQGDSAFLEYFYREYLRDLQSSERQLPVELAVEIIRLARELKDPGFLEYFRHQYLRDLQRFDRQLPVELAIEIIQLARELGDWDTLEYFNREYSRIDQRTLDSLPLSAVSDIHWLAKEFHNKKLLTKIDSRIKHQEPPAFQARGDAPRREYRERPNEDPLLTDIPWGDEGETTAMAEAFRAAARQRKEESEEQENK